MALASFKQSSEQETNDMAKALNKLPAIALSPDLQIRSVLADFFKTQGWSADGVINADHVQAVELLSQSTTPPIVMIDVDAIGDPVAYLEQLSNVCDADSEVLVIGKDNRIQTYHAIKALGVMDYLPKPLSIQDLEESFAEKDVKEVVDGSQGIEKAVSIAVIGARGGVGATSIALEIARSALPADMAKKLKSSKNAKIERNTVFLDLDVHFGCAALYTDIQPTHALVEALANPERIDDLFLERSAVTLENGMQLLAAEDDPTHPVQLEEDSLDILYSRVMAAYKTVVLDCPKYLLPQFSAVAEQLSHLVIVAEPNIASLRDAIRICSWVDTLSSKPEIHVVINKTGQSKNAELSLKDIAQTLGREPIAALSFSIDAFSLAAEKGVAVMDSKAPKQIKQELTKLHDAIFGNEDETHKTSLMSKLLGRKS